MKLIDLLVQELPKHGGWNEDWVVVTQDADGYFCCWRYDDQKYNGLGWRHVTGAGLVEYWRADNDVVLSCDSTDSIVTRNQYESALAASQKPAWNGEGLPPVGCECEFISNDISWGVVKVIGLDGEKIVIRPSGEIYYAITQSNKEVFIPLRTEAERKRDAAVEKIKELLMFDYGDDLRVNDATFIYDAIAAGKIPGVKLDD